MYEMFHDIDLYRNHFLGNKNSTSSERVKFLTFNSQLNISLTWELFNSGVFNFSMRPTSYTIN